MNGRLSHAAEFGELVSITPGSGERATRAAGSGGSNDAVTVVDRDHARLDQVFAGAGMQPAEAQLYRDGLRRGEAGEH